MSKIPGARAEAQNSLEIAKIADNKYQQVRALLLLGSVAYTSGDTAQAQQFVTQAIDLARVNEMEDLTTQGLLDLGNASLLKRVFEDGPTLPASGSRVSAALQTKAKRSARKFVDRFDLHSTESG